MAQMDSHERSDEEPDTMPNAIGEAKVGKGRPPAGRKRDVVNALLTAANRCFEHTDPSRVTVRQIAEVAHVNQAMINYYFQSKEGLLSSVCEQSMINLSGDLDDFLEEIESGADDNYGIEDLIKFIEEFFEHNASIHLFDVTNNLQTNSPMYEKYTSNLAGRAYKRISKIIAVFQRRGQCRLDMQPDQIAYIICAQCGFASIMNPVFFSSAFKADVGGEDGACRRRILAQLLAESLHSPL